MKISLKNMKEKLSSLVVKGNDDKKLEEKNIQDNELEEAKTEKYSEENAYQKEENKGTIEKYKERQEKGTTTIQEKSSKWKSVMHKFKVIFFVFNIFSLALYSTYTFYSLYNNNKSTIFSRVLVIVLIVYAFIFLSLIISGLGNKKKLKTELKNYKSSVNILKSIIKILNLALAIMTAINVFVSSGKLNIPLIIFGILSIFVAFLSILFEILKIAIRKKIALKKSREAVK